MCVRVPVCLFLLLRRREDKVEKERWILKKYIDIGKETVGKGGEEVEKPVLVVI